jgi:flavin-dependent dehydrogenase
METGHDIIIIGGGLAGLTAGIHFSKEGRRVLVLEKSGYPKHKVCGEYVSGEIVPYLEWLGIDVAALKAVSINKFEFSASNGKTVTAILPLGGIGISRYALDYYLYQKALENGCEVVQAHVTDVQFNEDSFIVTAGDVAYTAKVVIGAYGKRSNIDQVLSREFIKGKSPWLAVKAHYSGNFPDHVVGLHNFDGGYCGVSKVEGGLINVCYLADYESFKKYKNIEEYQDKVLAGNMNLKKILAESAMVFDKPVTISQICFDRKQPVENHILMAGDTAGLIHPLCGNGMAMAIHSAKIASETVLDFLNGKSNRLGMEQQYKAEWRRQFSKRLAMGRVLGRILQNRFLTKQLMRVVSYVPALLPVIIKQTHGKPIKIANG